MIKYHYGGIEMRYDKEFKQQALLLSDEIGVKKAELSGNIRYSLFGSAAEELFCQSSPNLCVNCLQV